MYLDFTATNVTGDNWDGLVIEIAVCIFSN